jgi:hypothetical protein
MFFYFKHHPSKQRIKIQVLLVNRYILFVFNYQNLFSFQLRLTILIDQSKPVHIFKVNLSLNNLNPILITLSILVPILPSRTNKRSISSDEIHHIKKKHTAGGIKRWRKSIP